MGFRIVIAGESQCEVFAEISLVADYLKQNLPSFCYERVEKHVLDWEQWLFKVNQKNKWHHKGSPIIWKEMLIKGSRPYYIGGASEFLEYCHSYYKFDTYLAPKKFQGLPESMAQYQQKILKERNWIKQNDHKYEDVEAPPQTNFTVSISGAGNPLTMYLIAGLLDLAVGDKYLSRIFIYDSKCPEFMPYIEQECSYVTTNCAKKVVKHVDKIGLALSQTDLLIILDHAPLDENKPLGDWLAANHKIMTDLSLMINASASRKMYVLFPNLGPACYNATVLTQLVQLPKKNIVVATSDLGLEISSTAAEIAEVSLRNMFCPPVWGFVGINHLVDILTTVHKYDSFGPYNRYLKVKNSSLIIGSITPELRTMEYLMYFDRSLWKKVAEKKTTCERSQDINKAVAAVDVVKLWLFDRNPDHVVSLGIACNGSFGLSFDGKFSQPSRFINGKWRPAADFLLPKDPYIKLKYLEKMAEFTMNLKEGELPKVVPYFPCVCKKKYYYKKK